MRVKATVVALAALVVMSFGAPPVSAADKDCSDFKAWRQAQRFYESHGGPKRDPHRLDADHDGIACESLR